MSRGTRRYIVRVEPSLAAEVEAMMAARRRSRKPKVLTWSQVLREALREWVAVRGRRARLQIQTAAARRGEQPSDTPDAGLDQ